MKEKLDDRGADERGVPLKASGQAVPEAVRTRRTVVA